MAKIENVKAGDFLIVISDVYRKESIRPNSFEVEVIDEIKRRGDPEPLKVAAVSAPFILCERLIKRIKAGAGIGELVSVAVPMFVPIDSRFEEWSKVDGDYVREYCRLNEAEIPDEVKTDDDKPEKENRLCPVCVEPMSERMITNKWRLICSACQLKLVPIEG